MRVPPHGTRGETTTTRPYDETRRLLTLWWVPAAFAGAVTLLLLVLALAVEGWSALDAGGIAGIFTFLGAVSYFCAGGAFLMQWRADAQGAARARAAPDRVAMLEAELALLADPLPATLRAVRRRIRRANVWTAGWVLVLAPFGALAFLVLLALTWHEYMALLPPAWQQGLTVAGVVASIGASAFLAVTRLGGLRADPLLVDATVVSAGAFEGDDVADVVAAAAGISAAVLTVDVARAWRLAPDGLVALGWSGRRTFDRDAATARTVAPGERAVLVCSRDGHAEARLAAFAP